MNHSTNNTLCFAGYAALFDIADAVQDVIVPGAFARTLRSSGDAIPLYWQHRPEQQIGTIEHAQEDSRGLRVIGQIDNPDSRAASLLQGGSVNGLSFGYRAAQYRKTHDGRILDEIELFEISLVTRPLQHGARVHFVS